MNMDSIIESLAVRGKREHPEDIRREDGLLYCGKCGQAKEMRLEGKFSGRIVPIICRCSVDEQRMREEEERIRRVEERRERCLPRDNMRKMRFENADNMKHIQLARTFADNWEQCRQDGIGLIFWGSCGSGKSFAALCIANALIEKEVSVWFCSCVDLVSELMDKDKHGSIMDRVSRTPLLILDDLGAERETEFAREQICRVIDARLESGKPLICTTNCSLTEMQEAAEKTQARIFDRVLSACVPIRVVGPSRRKSIGEQKLSAFREIIENEQRDSVSA